MSNVENNEQHPFAYEAAFLDLIDASESRDAGIASFEQAFLEVQEGLKHDHLGEYAVDNERLMELASEVNDEWPYLDDIAIVSGRVYLADPDLAELVPESWGEPINDEEDTPCYYIEDFPLRSRGVFIAPERDVDNDYLVTDIAVGHAFALPEDDAGEPFVVAHIGELSKHQYERPTNEEAELRLSRRYPEQHALIEKMLRPDLQHALPRRLDMVANRLKEDLKSPVFRQYAEIFINQRLELDQSLPYVMVAKDEIRCFVGDSPFNADSGGGWVTLKLSEPTTLTGGSPVVLFSTDDKDDVHVHFIVESYSNENGDDPEYVSIDAHNVTNFKSMRTMRSLVSRAVFASGIGYTIKDGQNELEAILKAAEESEENHATISTEEIDKRSLREPEIIRRLTELETAFKDIAKIVRQNRTELYGSFDEAEAASRELLVNEVVDMLMSADVESVREFEFSGAGALRPRHERNITPKLKEEHPHIFAFGVDTDDPVVPLQYGDSFKGHSLNFIPSAYPVTRDDEVVGFAINPAISVVFETSRSSAVRWNGASLVDIGVEQRALIPLDGSVDVKIPFLEEYRERMKALDRLTKRYGRSPIVGRIHKFYRALLNEQSDGHIELEDMKIIRRLDGGVQDLSARGLNPATALRALESLLVDRGVFVSGTFYEKQGETLILEDEGTMNEAPLLIADVINHEEHGVGIVGKTGEDQLHFIPLRDMTFFKF